MECPICFEIIYKSATPSCSHHFCYTCLKDWCIKGGSQCPICKKYINEIKFDIEFDNINNKSKINYELNESNICNKIVVNFDNNDNAGITLENNSINYKRRPGVRVKNIKYDKKMYKSGIKKGDIIIFINNIPCSDHVSVINIINYSSANGKEIICELLK